MWKAGRNSSIDVPEAHTRYLPGQVVRIDDSRGHARIIRDPDGDHEVIDARPIADVVGTPPMARVRLHRLRA
jgi:hypothetical protein